MQNMLRSIIAMFMIIASPELFALGLGDAGVHSYMGQPLNVRVQLISNSQEELNTVTAGLASASAMETLGISRTVSMPLRFEVHADLDGPYILITSRLPVSDPVIQVVVEASWSGGRMIKEYTFFLDPPTFPSSAPAPLIINRAAANAVPDDRQVPEIYPLPAPEVLREQSTQEKPVVQAEVSIPTTPPAPVTEIATAPREPRQTATVPGDPVFEALPQQEPTPETDSSATGIPVSEAGEPADIDAEELATVSAGPEPAQELVQASAPAPEDFEEMPAVPASVDKEAETTGDDAMAAAGTADTASVSPLEGDLDQDRSGPANLESSGETLGPVQSGQTLWGIASTYARSTPYSVNQAMLAIQRLNPDAFGNNNINLLKRGAILRMPAGTEMGRVSVRQAMVEAMRQEAAFKAEKAGLPFDSRAPAYANDALEPVEFDNDAADSEAAMVAQQEVATVAEVGLLQLIPPSQDQDPGDAGTGSATQPTGAVVSEDLQEVLARTEEELANAQQENAYLNERIKELEERVKDSGGEITVTDGGLAELESRLNEERLSSEPKPEPVAVKTATPDEWYSGKTWWLGGLFLLVIAAVVWLLKRLAGAGGNEPVVPPVPGGNNTTVKAIRSEAEGILKSLDEPGQDKGPETEAGNAGEKGNVISLESYGDTSEKPKPPEVKPEPVEKIPSKPAPAPVDDGEAVELDGDDPETMLDLARAYISMSDPESARKILEEVIEAGNEMQVAEARGMMKEL